MRRLFVSLQRTGLRNLSRRSVGFRTGTTGTNVRRAVFGIGAAAVSTVALVQSAAAAEKEEAAVSTSPDGYKGPQGVQTDWQSWKAKNPHAAERLMIFSGRSNPQLAQEIADKLGVSLGKINIHSYADGEIGIQVMENVRGQDVYLVQPTCPPGINDNLTELLLMVSTMRRASARRITAIIPYYGYARQDRKLQSRVPISAADVARLLMAMGVDRVVGVDLHCGQIQGFFGPRTPCDNLEANVVALPYFAGLDLKGETTKVVSPDAGGVYRAKRFREALKHMGVDAGLAMIVKQRVKANEINRMDLVGSVEGCDVIMVDDMIDTAGTLTKAAGELKQRGAKRVYAFATHGVFSGPAYERIEDSVLEKVVICNSIPIDTSKPHSKIHVVSLADLLAQAIARIQSHKSVSALFSESDEVPVEKADARATPPKPTSTGTAATQTTGPR